jgi:hypothetical protein
MERRVAELLMAQLSQLDRPLNAATQITDQIVDGAERKQFRRGIGEIISKVYTELMRPIVREYPDLDPDKGKVD